ncbi:hypothetical protein SAMD00019534_080440 [Acytostelium subglobosum LB1]|uniref:hypothetical protein n=1 Tax=Acytostelium subglobosum LB1 TaxID=1410327 RepID=UPI00064503FC|nr:hypothetical protein SAMD00019534_080440 [Acytostelium subglobosum LB1]GAM24869.1 hypothetical protein SAMD00019534_080440 [Acytostelium subglobosum LB1]|eukprot:XP_012751958.1 hypothetical protein SAMD00019534_080440 [Acytostelium subglobosum LB1]
MFVEVNAVTPKSKTNAIACIDGKSAKWMSHRLFRENNVGHIKFIESDEYPFDATFWNNANVNYFMAEMSARSVNLSFIMSRNVIGTWRNLTFSLSHIPLTSLEIQLGPDDQMPNFNMLPSTLTELSIVGETFSTPGALPDTLTSLMFNVNVPIAPGTLPPRLKRLIFGRAFYQPIADGTFPPTLESVHFGPYFDEPLTSTNLPDSVTDVTLINVRYSHPFSHRACVKLLMQSDATFAPGMVFPNLTQLETQVSADVLISSTFPALRSLDYHIWNYLEMDYSTLPHTLTALHTHVARPIKSFPQGLDKLKLRCGSGFRLTNTTLPRSLRSLSLKSYRHPIEASMLPSTITLLTTISCESELDPSTIPQSIHTLTIRFQRSLTDEHMAQVLATTSLFCINVEGWREFKIELYRISDTLFLKYDQSILNRVTECAFIDIDSIMALFHK